MRITHNMLTRNYLSRMNGNLSSLTKSNEKMTSGRAYNKGYENVTDAGKALRLRKLVADNERYQSTIRDVSGRAAMAEDGLRSVNSLLIRVEDRVIEGLNGTMSPEDREKIATEIEKMQEEVFMIMNSDYSGKYLYNAAGNRQGTAPFTIENNELFYNGTNVDLMTKSVNGQILDSAGNPIQYNEPNYVDIGFGYEVNNGKVDSNTAFRDTYSGVESFGFGKKDGIPVNAWSLMGDMVKNLRNDNMDALGRDLDAIHTSMEFLLTSITEIGARTVTLEDTASRLETEYINFADIQKSLEGIDLSNEVIYNKDYEMSWLVTLQLGSKILPQTIFDFIR